MAQEAVEQLSLDLLQFVVARLSPHKVGASNSPARLRAEMTRAAIAGNPKFRVNELELARQGPSYTVDTVRHLRDEYRDAHLFLLLGADQLAEFSQWREPDSIADLVTVAALGRNGVDPDRLTPITLPSGRELEFTVIRARRIDLSSTEIRARVREDRSIRYLVPSSVREIIENHRLYRSVP